MVLLLNSTGRKLNRFASPIPRLFVEMSAPVYVPLRCQQYPLQERLVLGETNQIPPAPDEGSVILGPDYQSARVEHKSKRRTGGC